MDFCSFSAFFRLGTHGTRAPQRDVHGYVWTQRMQCTQACIDTSRGLSVHRCPNEHSTRVHIDTHRTVCTLHAMHTHVGTDMDTYVHVSMPCAMCMQSYGCACTRMSDGHTHTHVCLCAVCAHMCVCAVCTHVSMYALCTQPYGCVREHACTRTCSLYIRVCVCLPLTCVHIKPIGLYAH